MSMSPANDALVIAGVNASSLSFYKIGGAILVVLAGIWAFRKIMGLLSPQSEKLSVEQRYNRRYPDSDNGFL